MKFLKWFGNLFNFKNKYSKEEQKYHEETKRYGLFGHLLNLVLFSAIPLLALWGVFAIQHWGWKLFLIVIALGSICKIPSDFMITGIVALRHRAKMKIANKIEDVVVENAKELVKGEELTDEEKQQIKDKKIAGTSPKTDLIVGILSIVLSIGLVFAFVGLFFGLLINLG